MSTSTISNYDQRRPHSEIYQQLDIVEDTITTNTNAFVFGRSYHLIDANLEWTTNASEAVSACANLFDASDPVIVIRTSSDIENKIGPIEPNNTLAFGAYIALLHSEGKPIYADFVGGWTGSANSYCNADTTGNLIMSSITNDISDYQAVLNKIKNIDTFQYIVPLTYNIQEGSGSAATDLYTAVKTHITSCSTYDEKKWRRAYLTTDTSAFTEKTTIIGRVDDISDRLDSPRLINVWCHKPKYLVNGKEEDIATYFVAAAVAGLRSSVPVQQGLSTSVISFLSSASSMYTLMDRTSLNTIASHGTMIVYQEYEDQPVIIRHQLTTDTVDGLMYWEDSVGTNFDEISYAVKTAIKPFIGKRNNTPATLVELKNRFVDCLLERTADTIGSVIGPQIIEIVKNSVSVTLNKNQKDRVELRAQVVLPIPLNQIIVYIEGSVEA